MKVFQKVSPFRYFLVLSLVLMIHGCATDTKVKQDEDFGVDAVESTTEDASSDSSSELPGAASGDGGDTNAISTKDEFSDFDQIDGANDKQATTSNGQSETAAEENLEKELDSLEDKPIAMDQLVAPEALQASAEKNLAPSQISEDLAEKTAIERNLKTDLSQQEASALEPNLDQGEPVKSEPLVAAEPPPADLLKLNSVVKQEEPLYQIKSVLYQSNQRGGAVVINSDQPLKFTTRLNQATNQLVVEVPNTKISQKLKRSLNTKDMSSSIGSIDIYQKSKSNISRFVIQLRPGSSEPLVQPEGNSLLIIGSANPIASTENRSALTASSDSIKKSEQQSIEAVTAQTNEVNPDLTPEGIMNSQSLEDFLASNNRFYGKKISIEAVKLDINDAFKFLSEESGVNMIIDDGVKGDVTLKLRQVPWDQAFVLILKSKKLGYKRQGNVIRVAEIANLQKEEDDAIKLLESRKNVEPLIVKRFFIGYAEIAELEKKIKEFISTTALTSTGALAVTPSRGKVISDSRTNSLIVTETSENLQKIEKLVMALDTQPKQVLIEGKVVEANEKFTRSIGVQWGTSSTSVAAETTPIRPTVDFKSGIASSIFNPSVSIGRPDIVGNLNATLSLGESEDKLRILSSPRISVLSSQSATISQTVNVLIDKVSLSSTGTGITTTTKEPVAVGVSLKVTPQVSNEGTVVMDIDIERSFLATANGTDIEKRNAKTKVIVRSGQTAVIGGIFQADAAESTTGVPFFRDIPIFGVLFKGNQKVRNKNELVIFVTPKIQKMVQGDPATITQFN